MAITITDKLDEKPWREFVDAHPQGNIFHTPEMFRVFALAKGYAPELRAAVDPSGRVLALLTPVQVTLRGGALRRLTTRSIVYGSALCSQDAAGTEALAALLRHYTKNSGRASLFTELRHQSDLTTLQPVLEKNGFAYEEHLNYLIDLDCPPDEVFNKLGRHTRRNIRRAMKEERVIVDEAHDLEQIKAIYALLKKSYTNAQVPIADISLFEAAFEVLHPKNMVRFWLARTGDTPIASSIELVYKDVIYGWYGGVDRAYSSLNPNEMLTWHILNWGSQNGYRVYDFGGAGSPAEEYGVRDFKAKFGGRLVSYGRNTFVPAPALLRLSELGYSVLRRLMAG